MQTISTTDLCGDVLLPGDAGYEGVSSIRFADGSPAVVVRPHTTDEVATAIRYAREREMALSVRSGGHSPVGHSTNSGGMVIDLAHLDGVELVDPAQRVVRLGGGARWGRVAAALGEHGLALTAGDTTSVGVGGLTLGGGVGWMVRKHGLAIDNLVAARVVTADGRDLVASREQHADLFWALRGGGGNFGVVVGFDFVAQPVRTAHFGTITYPLDDPARTILGWRDSMREAPEELTSTVTLMPPLFGMPASAMVTLCHAGDPEVAEEVIRPLRQLGTVTDDTVSEQRYADILEDAPHPPGIRVIGRNTLMPSLDREVVDRIVAAVTSEVPTVFSLRSLGGAFGRVAPEATAFAHRDAEAMIIGGTIVAEGAGDSEVDEALAPWRTVAARGTGLYVNFQGSATAADVAAAYPPETYARLAAVKHRYDPENLFDRNHNVRPDDETRMEGPAA